jgi:hypothetical protein
MLVTIRHIQSTREMNSTFDDNKRLEIAETQVQNYIEKTTNSLGKAKEWAGKL